MNKIRLMIQLFTLLFDLLSRHYLDWSPYFSRELFMCIRKGSAKTCYELLQTLINYLVKFTSTFLYWETIEMVYTLYINGIGAGRLTFSSALLTPLADWVSRLILTPYGVTCLAVGHCLCRLFPCNKVLCIYSTKLECSLLQRLSYMSSYCSLLTNN